nr:sulfite exporter TauE/SafE family protein [Colwellia sp. 75C3]
MKCAQLLEKMGPSLIPGAMIGVSVAYLIIDFINAEHLQLIIGVICIVFSLKNLLLKQITLKALNNKAGALIMSIFSGLTSSLVHAGGPPIIIYFSAIGLAPAKFIATASAFFFIMNIFKLIGVTALGMLTGEIILTAMAFIPLAFVGNWIGVKINTSLNKQLFLTIMNYLLLLLGCWLVMTK